MSDKTIPTEVAFTMLADRHRARQLEEVILVFQEALVVLVDELHQAGALNADRVAHRIARIDVGQDGLQLAQMLAGRIASIAP